MDNEQWRVAKYSFFAHVECEYFPCHETDDPDDFNCLFCYCPLYMLGSGCGGDFCYTEQGYKNCQNCTFPHRRDNYGNIKSRYADIASAMTHAFS